MAESAELVVKMSKYMEKSVGEMQLEDKNVIVVIGPSRAGKGTTLAALLGKKMKKFRRAEIIEEFSNLSKNDIS